MDLDQIISRNGQWLAIEWPLLLSLVDTELVASAPKTGAHAHDVLQWLLRTNLFPAKWLKRIFSIGGIGWNGQQLQLLAYSQGDYMQAEHFVAARQLTAKDVEGINVLYEDDFCLVLSKSTHLPVHQSSPTQTKTLDAIAAKYAVDSGHPFPVRHIHRLDADTSGAILYSKNDWAQLRLDEAMRQGTIERYYTAAVHGEVTTRSGEINKPIAKDRNNSGKRRIAPHGDQAITRYWTIRSSSALSIVSLQLLTGRTHQIRVHMSAIGHPLLGDTLYGGRSIMGMTHQALHASELKFPHPVTGKMIAIQDKQPDWLKKLMNS